MLDLRVPVGVVFEAFAVPATITRPAPSDVTPLSTSIVWMSSVSEDAFSGLQLQRREQKHLIAVRHDQVPNLPRKTVILAPRALGGTVERWMVDGTDRQEDDLTRYLVVEAPDPNTTAPEL